MNLKPASQTSILWFCPAGGRDVEVAEAAPAGRGGQGRCALCAAEAHPGTEWGDRPAGIWVDGGADKDCGGRVIGAVETAPQYVKVLRTL
jgi:hypothetical protein